MCRRHNLQLSPPTRSRSEPETKRNLLEIWTYAASLCLLSSSPNIYPIYLCNKWFHRQQTLSTLLISHIKTDFLSLTVFYYIPCPQSMCVRDIEPWTVDTIGRQPVHKNFPIGINKASTTQHITIYCIKNPQWSVTCSSRSPSEKLTPSMDVTWEEEGMEEEGGVGAFWMFPPNIRLRSLVQLDPFCPFFMVAGGKKDKTTIKTKTIFDFKNGSKLFKENNSLELHDYIWWSPLNLCFYCFLLLH